MKIGIATDHGGFGLKEELINPRRMHKEQLRLVRELRKAKSP